jgi:hypothetical protein
MSMRWREVRRLPELLVLLILDINVNVLYAEAHRKVPNVLMEYFGQLDYCTSCWTGADE